MANIGNRIQDLIGSDYNVIPADSVTDLVNSAIAEVADVLPPELLLKYIDAAGIITLNVEEYATVEGKKILSVTRNYSGDADAETVQCTAVPTNEYNRCKNINSIYEATALSPVYSYIPIAGGGSSIKVYPEPTVTIDATIYAFVYPTTDIYTSGSSVPGMPTEVTQAVVLKSCINILQSYISDFVQEEEDSELQGMLEAQKESLLKLYANEMGRYMEQDATPRGE